MLLPHSFITCLYWPLSAKIIPTTTVQRFIMSKGGRWRFFRTGEREAKKEHDEERAQKKRKRQA
jgi:hypothetical protein